jgi:hypothetical protein
LLFHETTVAPYSRMSTLSPLGRRAATRPLPALMSTEGPGAAAPGALMA